MKLLSIKIIVGFLLLFPFKNLNGQYCSPTFTSDVEPITFVGINTISNSSVNTCGAGASLEDFTAQSTNLVQGQSYTISVGGNTCGNYTVYVRVYFDWNQNDVLDDAGEVFNIGTITNSTGATTITANITVPVTATLGTTRMRVMKRYGGYSTSSCQTGPGYGQGEDYTVNIISPAPTATLLNFSANPTQSTMFANRRSGESKPKFTLQSNTNFNKVQIELNTLSNYTGTSFLSTLDSSGVASVSYDYRIVSNLTLDNQTYFVRARLSSDGGSTWGSWTNQLWPYSYYSSTLYPEDGWYYTTKEQFQTGIVQESNYNFISVEDNATAFVDDDYFQLNEGIFSINAGTGDGVRERGTWYPSVSYMTIGWQNNCNGNAAIYNGWPFVVQIPQAAVINSANFSVVSTTACVCESQNVSMRLIVDAHAVDNGPVFTGANVSSLVTPARTTANQTFLYSTSWSNNTRYTLTSIPNILQEVIGRPGWNAGNTFNLLARWNSAFTPGSNNNRCIRQSDNGSTTAPRIEGAFTNFKNTVYFPTVDRAIYGPDATSWDKIRVTDNTVGCGTCYVEYRIHNAANNGVVAGPFLRPAGMSTSQFFDISAVTNQNIFVSATVYRNNTPLVHDIWLTATEPSSLPVKLNTFEIDCENNFPELKWTTATEINNDYFTVERSSTFMEQELNFIEIARVKGNGNSNINQKYRFVDDTYPVTKINEKVYYRLKQNDFNGKFEYFYPVLANCNIEQNEISIYPNPNEGKFYINGVKKDNVVKVYNQLGILIFNSKTLEDYLFDVDISSFAKGIYFVQLLNEKNEIIKQQKIVKE